MVLSEPDKQHRTHDPMRRLVLGAATLVGSGEAARSLGSREDDGVWLVVTGVVPGAWVQLIRREFAPVASTGHYVLFVRRASG